MTEHSLWRFSRALHRAINDRQLDDISLLIDEDVDWAIFGPIDMFPFLGARRGKAAVMEVIRQIADNISVHRFDRETVMLGVDSASSMLRYSFTSLESGKPISLLLTQQNATVTLCHKFTKDLACHTRNADILVSSVGKPGLIAGDHVKQGAVVIDVGINRVTLPDGTKKTVGDVDFDTVSPRAAHLTPVPGGVGPMTVALLLRNTLHCAELLAKQSSI